MLATAPRYYAQQQRLTALAVRQLRRYDRVADVLPRLALYQASAALLALDYGSRALDEQGISDAGSNVIPAAFTVTPGAPSVLDDVSTRFHFDRIVATLVADAGRSAMGTYTASRTHEIGSVRQLSPPSCSRCAILAGRWYRWSEGFQRHPLCDCIMVPGGREIATYDPHAAYERGEISDLTEAQRQAIDDGADINQVVNASRGTQTVNFAGRRVQITTEGTTSRGLAYRSLVQRGGSQRVDAGFATRITASGPETRAITKTVSRAPRLSPEAIYRVSDGDRPTAIRLLRANGYLT